MYIKELKIMKQVKKLLTLILTVAILASSSVVPVFAVNSYNNDSTLASAEIKHTTNEISLFSTSSSISVKHNNTIDEVVEKEKEFSHDGFIYSKQTNYETVPKLTAPYYAGSLKEQDLNDALNSLKMVRYLAGIPYNNIIID